MNALLLPFSLTAGVLVAGLCGTSCDKRDGITEKIAIHDQDGEAERLEAQVFELTNMGYETFQSEVGNRKFLKEFFEQQGVTFSWGSKVGWHSKNSIRMVNTSAQLLWTSKIIEDLNHGVVLDISKIADGIEISR